MPKPQSNTYILAFTALMTVLLGAALSLTSVLLKPLQDEQLELDAKKKILRTVYDLSAFESKEDIQAFYKAHVQSFAVSLDGEIIEKDNDGVPLVPERINIRKNHKIDPEKRFFPVFVFKKDANNTSPDAYIFPMFGAGLWDWISGYVALGKDLNTIQGVAFDHKAETPGLGARITSNTVQQRYQNKEIFSQTGQIVAVEMLKGEQNKTLDTHQVDGMSGATMTARGVNKMLKSYLNYYKAFINKAKEQTIQQ